MDIVARADGGAGAGGEVGGGGVGGGVEFSEPGLLPESITVTAPRIDDTGSFGTTINVGGSFTSLLGGLSGTPPAAPAGGGTNFTVTSHKRSTAPASPQGSDQAGQSSGDGSSAASPAPAPGISGWQPTVSSNPAPSMPSGDPDASGTDGGGAPGASSSGGGGVGGGGGAGGSGGARTEAAGLSPQAAAAAIAADYQRILGRAPDAEGLATFTQAVLLGRMNLAQVAQTLATSPEARTDLGAVISDVQGRPTTAQDDPWIHAQQAALAAGSTTLADVRQNLASFSGEAGVIASMYQGLVGRAPSAAEIAATEGQLAAGVSLQSIRTTDAKSPEAAAQLGAIYQSVLGRQADPSGLAACESELANGGTLAQVREATAQSSEAQADLKTIIAHVQGRPATAQDDPWIQAQQAALAAGSTTLADVRQDLATFSGEAGVVTSMYQGLVGRAPSAAEIAATEGQLAAGVSLQTIRTADASSPEAAAQLDAIYQSVLGRQADPTGLAACEAELANGGTLAHVQGHIAQSPEVLADIEAIIFDVQGRQLTAGDQSWIQTQQAQLGSGATTIAEVANNLASSDALQGVPSAWQLDIGLVFNAPANLGSVAAERTPGLGASASMAQLLQNDAVPGRQGVILTDVGEPSDLYTPMFTLSQKNDAEYALARVGSDLILYSGSANKVAIPASANPIAHTHPHDPKKEAPQSLPSRADVNILNSIWSDDPAAPRPFSDIIWGSNSDQVTRYYATGIDQIPDPSNGGQKSGRTW